MEKKKVNKSKKVKKHWFAGFYISPPKDFKQRDELPNYDQRMLRR